MSITFGRTQKAATLVPLAAASVLWTASLVGVGSASADQEPAAGTTLPDGSTVPTEAIEAPASMTRGLTNTRDRLLDGASANGIPAPALAAYQRAETIINAADKGCKLPWQLVAAIGRVESDHGRFGGNVLDDQGVARPGIYGIALNGTKNTQKITDTDAGQYDKDKVFDRAVGPMQFIPSTWQVVGVDADTDGKRNPQDIDDAALATAVYLCSGNDDLSTRGGQEKSVFRYNHSQDYVDLVLSIMNAYLKGDYTSVPGTTTSAGWLTPDPAYVPPGSRGPRNPGQHQGQGSSGDQSGSGSTNEPSTTDPGDTTEDPIVPQEPAPENPLPDNPLPSLPQPSEVLPSDPVPSTSVPPVDTVVTYAEALAMCTAQGIVDNPLTAVNELQACIKNKQG